MDRKRLGLRWVVAGLITLIIVAVFSSLIWYMVEIQPVSRNAAAQSVSFELKSGTSLPQLSQQLKAAGIIRNPTAFSIYIVLKGARRKLEAGFYDLNPRDTVGVIANTLSRGKITENTVVVPEGFTVTKIRSLVATKGITNQAFDAALAGHYSNSFLAGRPAGDSSLEGYLFPDSYELKQPPDATTLVQEMLNSFGQTASQAGLTQAYAAEGLTLHQGVTLASIVEREAGTAADRPIIAQVFLKRLQMGMPLQSDVTVDYASQLTGLPFSTTLASPYNTYANVGLPPGPIANPGLSSLEAVAQPADTSYLYFLADKNGVVHYAQTAAEHEANVQKYLGQ